jgi:hypothetical protein
MGGQQQPAPPSAYSTRTTYGSDGWRTDGHRVVIDPGTLQASVNTFREQLQGQSSAQLTQTLFEALGAANAFGDVPNAAQATVQLQQFVNSHAAEMAKMQDGTLVEFVARVQAAAQLGYETDPVTRRAAMRAMGGRMAME